MVVLHAMLVKGDRQLSAGDGAASSSRSAAGLKPCERRPRAVIEMLTERIVVASMGDHNLDPDGPLRYSCSTWQRRIG